MFIEHGENDLEPLKTQPNKQTHKHTYTHTHTNTNLLGSSIKTRRNAMRRKQARHCCVVAERLDVREVGRTQVVALDYGAHAHHVHVAAEEREGHGQWSVNAGLCERFLQFF